MKIILKIFKWFAISMVSLLLVGFGIGFLFLSFSPQFGGSVTDSQKIVYQKTGHYKDGKFTNIEKANTDMTFDQMLEAIDQMMNPVEHLAPSKNIEVIKVDPNSFKEDLDSNIRITWFGHSSTLIEIDTLKLLIDPVFGQVAAPHPWLGSNRYNREMPIEVESLPEIDAIFISHDHYDHLDFPSIQALKSKTREYFVPLGVGNHLLAWGIEKEHIHEMDWWQDTTFSSLNIAFTPSRHFSGRGINDQFATLWGSWVFKGTHKNIYYSGDGSYGAHFKLIGERYGPFDIALMECGQYNDLWKDVHMKPEETVLATQDVQAALLMPVHWGAFTLATHSWIEPIERASKKALELNLPITTPKIGESVILESNNIPKSKWWIDFL